MAADFMSPQFWLLKEVLLNDLVRHFGYTQYLEIGIGDGYNFARISCDQKTSVDINSGGSVFSHPEYLMSSDDYFKECKDRFDLVFIDGLHHCDQLVRDVENSLQILNPGGIVVCHDINPMSEPMQMVPHIQDEWTGDCWRAWVELRGRENMGEMIAVGIPYGIGLILPIRQKLRFNCIDMEEPTWEDFEKNRMHWINLMSPKEAARFIGSLEMIN